MTAGKKKKIKNKTQQFDPFPDTVGGLIHAKRNFVLLSE